MKRQLQVLITGGAGFIGRKLTKLLMSHEFDVTILNTRSARGTDIFEMFDGKVEYREGDVRNRDLVFDCVENKDIVIHLAAGSSFLMYEREPIFETVNVIQGFLNVLEAAKHYGIKKLIYASTSAVYEGNKLPYQEDMRLYPPDHKALAKKNNEEWAALYSKRYGIKTIAIRPFSVYGDGEDDKGEFANVISLFAWAMLNGNSPIVWGDGNQTRDFIFVDDLAEIFYKCIVNNVNIPVINAGTGVETSFNQVIGAINEYLQQNLEPVYIPVPIDIYAKRLLANTALQEEMDLRAKTDVREGIRRVIESAKSLGETLRQALGTAQERYKNHLPKK